MTSILPDMIKALPQANISIPGCHIYILQAEERQLVFMEFSEDTLVAEHSHAAQWEYVLAGQVEITIGGVTRVYRQGESFVAEDGVMHSAKISAGYTSLGFFCQPDRYAAK